MLPKEEKTYVMIKPDGVARGLIGEIISRFERRGLKIIALAMEKPTREKVDGHYPKDPVWVERLGHKTLKGYEKYNIDAIKMHGTDNPSEIGKFVRSWLLDFMISGPVVKMVIQGIHSVDMVRKICGETMPYLAQIGTIRGDYSIDSPAAANKDQRSVYNIVHASETREEADHEISFWFTNDQMYEYKRSEEGIAY